MQKKNLHLDCEALIAPFDDQSLVDQLLLVHDKIGNTPMFYAYTGVFENINDFIPLLERIKHLNVENKRNLLKVQNENGSNSITCYSD